MKEVNITRLNGTYYRLTDCYGEIEFSDNLEHIKQLFVSYSNDKDLQKEMYHGDDMQLAIYKEQYVNGDCIYEIQII